MRVKDTWRKTERPFREPHSPAAKLLRCLQIIKALEIGRLTVRQMAKRFDISERTAYRYVALFEEAGFIIDKDFNNKFFIVKE